MTTYRGVPLHRADHLHLSNHGLLFLVVEEGVSLRPYTDSSGWATAGIGHLILPQHKGITVQDREHYTFRTRADAFAFFRRVDAPLFNDCLHHTLGASLVTRAMWDVCFSLAFNIGVGGFAGSSVARYIRAGNYAAAGRAFFNWANPPVLYGRRSRESHRFLIGHW